MHVDPIITLDSHLPSGDPPPRVTWWLENALLDEDNDEHGKGSAINTLVLHNLDRKMHNAVLTCQASNTRQVAPLSTKATMQLNREWENVFCLTGAATLLLAIRGEKTVRCQIFVSFANKLLAKRVVSVLSRPVLFY